MKGYRHIVLALLLLLAPFGAMAQGIDINKADAKTLADVMVGVGPNKAAAIVAYREHNGPFKTIHELTRVRGIGQVTVQKNEQRIAVLPDAKQ